MITVSSSTRGLAGLAFAALVLASPTVAKNAKAKPVEITISDKTFVDATSRMCMPRTMIDRSRKSTLPKTMCHTRAEWESKGVMFKTK